MSKTKEEILDDYYLPRMHWKSVNREQVFVAMEEYAKSEAIEFSEWCQNENYSYTDSGTWYLTDYPVSSNQLYDMYLKSKQP